MSHDAAHHALCTTVPRHQVLHWLHHKTAGPAPYEPCNGHPLTSTLPTSPSTDIAVDALPPALPCPWGELLTER